MYTADYNYYGPAKATGREQVIPYIKAHIRKAQRGYINTIIINNLERDGNKITEPDAGTKNKYCF